jgi:opacity protein-like surface antigen
MKRFLLLTVLTVAALTSIASADRGRHRGWGGHGRGHSEWRGGGSWGGGVVVQPRVVVQSPRVVVRPRIERHRVFVRRPVVQYRYYDYYQRPTVIAENYPTMAGYYWVAGQWQWSGYEWTWQAGHYEPDPNYTGNDCYQGAYDNGQYYYDSSTYQTYSQPTYGQPAVSGGVYFSAGASF